MSVQLPDDSAPRWARLLLASICTQYRVVRPVLRWRLQAGASTGPCAVWQRLGSYKEKSTPPTIIVYAGTNHLENRMTLLHETAHHLAYVRKGLIGHREGFWIYCWQLYHAHRVPLHEAVLSEFGYMARAETVLHSMGIRLSHRAAAAAQLGRAVRRILTLEVQIRRLRTRLSLLSSPTRRAPIQRSLRRLSVQERQGTRLVARHARAYKRVARPS